MINVRTKNLEKGSNPYFVVTRGGRRVEEKNYTTQPEAELRAAKLVSMVSKYSPHEKNNISIVRTSEPYRIR
ncbi:MAG: hypothetical protein HN786_05720 [Cellvibrionales bacterium]|jgi:hypothetical protein|nr:hypothetical protein [Cellvibrionales bacterium]